MLSILLLLPLSTAFLLTSRHPGLTSKPPASQQLAQEVLQSSSDYCIVSGVSGYSGFVPVLADNSSMYYWLTNKLGTDITTDASPLIMWLDGGPGGSSFNGNLNMVGPLYINASLVPVPRAVTWASKYHLLFIDNPLGAGYSFVTNESDYSTTETQVAANVYTALLGLNTLHPQWFLNRDLYIFGVSYAGKYIPSVATYILQMNQSPGQVQFPLRGIGIGDGLTDPVTQFADYSNYGFAAGLMDEGERQVVEEYERKTIQAIENEDLEIVWSTISEAYQYIGAHGNVSIYDVRSYNFDLSPYGIIWAGLNTTKSLLHIPPALPFAFSSAPAFKALNSDIGKSVISLFPYLLQHLKVLLYNGQDDLIISPSGAQNWIDSIVWPGQTGFLAAKKEVWTVQGQVAGYMRSFEGLTQVIVLDAGHGVEIFQPENAMAMVTSFIGS
jgi:carboxypeptidase C (cathepsin A)